MHLTIDVVVIYLSTLLYLIFNSSFYSDIKDFRTLE